jgi:arylsulfatase A-like enzyme
MTKMNRRNFLTTTAATATAVSTLGLRGAFAADGDKPNILMIISDQLNAFTIGAAGCDIKTPNIDKLAKAGCRFETSYTTYPLCVPWRSSMASGHYPHEFGMQGNNGAGRSPKDRENFAKLTQGNTAFSLVRDAGYECYFTGKWHMTMAPENADFNGVTYNKSRNASRDQVCNKGEELIKEHSGDKPFFITVSFDTPHEICGWRRSHFAGEGNLDGMPPAENCPPLPDNYEREPDVPEPVRVAYEKNTKTEEWNKDDWRQHIWAYQHYTEVLDEYVGRLMKALEESGHDKDTLVVFIADHGDGNASHRWGGKVALWEESVRVPLIFWKPGLVKSDHVVKGLVATGLDMMPTLCDFAGGKMPEGYMGVSLKPQCLGGTESPHDHVVR